MTEQHYRMTLTDAIAKYQAGDITAKGLIHFYILIKCKPGWKIRLEHQKICKELGIAKTAFYNSISRLRDEGSIEWEAPKGILVSISSTFRECGIDSASAEIEFTNAEFNSASAETKSLNPLLDKASSNPPDLLTNSYQLFINSLSEGEREDFLKFAEQKTAQLPHSPTFPWRLIEKNWQELATQWYKSRGQLSPVQTEKWENHQQRLEWLHKIRTLGFAAFIYEDGSLDKQRQEFYQWAESKNLIWEDES